VAAEQLSQISHRANLGFHALALGVDGGEPDAERPQGGGRLLGEHSSNLRK